MTHPIEVFGCIKCDIEYKDEKEAQDHFNKFRAKDDLSHVRSLVKLIGVVQKSDKKKKRNYPSKKMTKKNVKKLVLKNGD